MNKLHFEWDETKNRTNERKHNVSFEEAMSVFYDDHARVIADPDHSEKEDRFIIIGLSQRLRMLVVCHCYRKDSTSIRIISARKAKDREQIIYEENL